MQYPVHMQIFECDEYACYKELYIEALFTGLLFVELVVPDQVVPKVSTIDKVHD